MAIKQAKGVANIPDNNSNGTWEVLTTVRKAYLTIKRD